MTARLESGTLRVQEGRCPNLLAEAQLYRYGEASETGPESPESEHNHALDALRYLINTMDAHRLARPHGTKPKDPAAAPHVRMSDRPLWWRMLHDPALNHLWTRRF